VVLEMVVPLVMVVQLGHALYPFLQVLQALPLVVLEVLLVLSLVPPFLQEFFQV
jgi:hypothetical protein